MRDMVREDSIAVEIAESLCYAAVGGIGKLDKISQKFDQSYSSPQGLLESTLTPAPPGDMSSLMRRIEHCS